MKTPNLNLQATELNKVIKNQNPAIFELLSEKGRAIYFPKDGILAQTAEAKGTKINATIGVALKDDMVPFALSSISNKILLDPKDIFPYAPSFGKPELRSAWLEQIKKKNPSLNTRTSTPIVTNAVTHALNILGYLFINKGDIIISPDKFWGNYRLIFENGYGGVLTTFNMFKNEGFDTGSFKDCLNSIRSNKITILLNFPNNPTGYTPTEKEAEKIILIIKKMAEKCKKILVICDDAYFGLIFEKDIITQSLFPYLAGLHQNILVVKADGATKEEYVWGFLVGFITYASDGITEDTCKALESKTAGAIRGSISNASHLSQSLVLQALSSSSYHKDKRENFLLLKKRYEKVKEVLKNRKYSKYFSPLPYNSGYFMCIELKSDLNAENIRQKLLKEYDTGVIAVKNLLRIAFSSVAEKNIPQLFENILSACRN